MKTSIAELLEQAQRHQQSGALTEAVACYRQALQGDPRNVDIYTQLALVLKALGQMPEAIECHRQALRLDPQFAEALDNLKLRQADAHNNLGTTFMDQGQATQAAESFVRTLDINPNHAEARNNLSNAYLRLGRLMEARTHNEQALQINPNLSVARWDRALLRLLEGDFLGGWPDYEQRWALPGVAPRFYDGTSWDGSPFCGKTILLHAEQGLGDTIQFVRYMPLVKERGGTIVLVCQPQLASLLSRMPEISAVVPIGAPLPPYDIHVPLLSLPGIFKTTVATIPAEVPYLRANSEKIDYWRQEIARGGSPPTSLAPPSALLTPHPSPLRVGIAWQGNPKVQIDRYRSFPLAHFQSLAKIEGTTLVSLQVGAGRDQLAQAPFAVTDLGEQFDPSSLEDLAAAILNMDLLVTSDSAIAHLAGALGAPIFVALGLTPDWRWLLERPDCPWYPTMRLFRQRTFGDWGEVFERIAAEVRDKVTE